MASGVAYTLIGLVVLVAVIAAWRVLVHDKTIRRIRFGVFYEREREPDDLEHDEPADRWQRGAEMPLAPKEES
jgi:hypothetical protein